jgi:acetyl esterase/lipase
MENPRTTKMAGCLTVLAAFSILLSGAARVSAAGPVSAAESASGPPVVKKTYVYKVVGDCRIEADVYRADDAVVRPGVVWMHGGALILGSRRGVPGRLLDLCRSEGFVLVSIDYRLAPEVRLPEIIDDVQDAWAWTRSEGPRLFQVDPEKLVAAGGSAGGYLTMMTGICVRPRPTALVAYWGYGDVDGPWYTRPSPYYRQAVPLISKEDAYRGMGGNVLTGVEGGTPEQKARGLYYRYLRQNGLWTREVTGFDPDTERRKLDPYCPVRNITSEYPPILMIHGTDDNDVPYEQSAAMARELARHHVPHELITVPAAGHGLGGGDQKLVADAHARALAFIEEHLK